MKPTHAETRSWNDGWRWYNNERSCGRTEEVGDKGHGQKRARRIKDGEGVVRTKGPDIKTCEELHCVRART